MFSAKHHQSKLTALADNNVVVAAIKVLTKRRFIFSVASLARPADGVNLPAAPGNLLRHIGHVRAGDIDIVVVVVAQANARATDALRPDAVAGPGPAVVAIDPAEVGDALSGLVEDHLAKAGVSIDALSIVVSRMKD